MTTAYGINTIVKGVFEEVASQAREALKAEGFGILTEIDVQAKMQEKLGKELPKHVILGACNPAKAYEALTAEHDVSLLLPCNVILYEGDGVTPGSEDGTVVVAAIRPTVAMAMVGNEKLTAVAEEIEERLTRVIAKMEMKE